MSKASSRPNHRDTGTRSGTGNPFFRGSPGIFCVALCLGVSVVGCAGPAFQAGVSVSDITPDHDVPLGGYGARKGAPMKGVHDRIFAKALWLETETTRVCLITADLIGMSAEVREEILKRLPPGYCHLVIAASHNHSGPGALTKNPLVQIAMGNFDQKLYDTYVDVFTNLVLDASKNRAPAGISLGRGEAPELQRNRRAKHYEGPPPVDPEIVVLRVGRAVLTNYTAHPTILGAENMLVSGDWPGAFQRTLEKREVTALFTNGAQGDLSPQMDGGEDFDRCERMGAALAAHVERILNDIEESTSDVALAYVEETLDLPETRNRFVPKKSVFGVLAINDAAFLCVPGEMSAELGLALKRWFRERGFRHVAILGLANDHLGYFLTAEQFKKGGYERDVSFYGSGMGEFLIRTYQRLGEKVRPARIK